MDYVMRVSLAVRHIDVRAMENIDWCDGKLLPLVELVQQYTVIVSKTVLFVAHKQRFLCAS